jgi:hypothetical protein
MELYLPSTTFLHGVQWDNFTFFDFHRTKLLAYLKTIQCQAVN